ncbi:MAG: GNAT family N-acetyltransferase, partial [Chthoniobacterales bacterium]
ALESHIDDFESAQTAFFRFSDVQPAVLAQELLARGADGSLSFWQVLDLRKSEDDLKSDIRKSYKNLINRGAEEFEYRVFAEDCAAADLEAFRELHVRAAGRSTRSDASWNMQLQKIQTGEAFLVLGRENGVAVSGAYFLSDGRTCYYGSAASPEKAETRGGSHALIWQAVKFAKERGCSHMDLGQVLFPGQHCVIDIHARPVLDGDHELPGERELGISRFKKGFGGATVARLDLVWKPATSSKSTTSA